MFEDGEVEKVILALDVGRLLVLVLVGELTLEKVAGLLLALPKNIRLDLFALLLIALQLVDIPFATLLLRGDVQVALDLHVGQDLAGDVVVGDGELPEAHVALPGEEEVVGRQDLELVFYEFLHPLDFVELALELDVVTHEQTHLVLGEGLQHF